MLCGPLTVVNAVNLLDSDNVGELPVLLPNYRYLLMITRLNLHSRNSINVLVNRNKLVISLKFDGCIRVFLTQHFHMYFSNMSQN